MISLYEIPNTALVAELAPDYDKRTTLSALHGIALALPNPLVERLHSRALRSW
ncbi:MAG TPA: hypothetical protein VNR65_00245 [Geobacterales bacterium]|nr:hypothetical protein [Geobacterales bacterium]